MPRASAAAARAPDRAGAAVAAGADCEDGVSDAPESAGTPMSAPPTPPAATAAATTRGAKNFRDMVVNSLGLLDPASIPASAVLGNESEHRSGSWQEPGERAETPKIFLGTAIAQPFHSSPRDDQLHMAAHSETDARILVVDDEPNITDLVATALRYEGFEVAVAGTGSEAIREAATFRPDLLVLDVMLPDRNGFELLSRLRADQVKLPVVFLTARDSTEDKIKGLTVGGDDYVTKPFSLEELLARVRAVLCARAQTREDDGADHVRATSSSTTTPTRCGAGVERIDLTPTEYKLLRYLMHNARRVLSKAQILDHVWEYDFDGDANVVETYVSYLRKKLDPHGPPLIHTVRGVGYSLRLPPED